MRRFLLLGAVIFLPTALHAQPRRLSLNDAIQAALENNADLAIAAETTEQSKARADEQRSTLLPNLNASISHTSRTVNLGAMGISFGPIPGFPAIPRQVGPFDINDARVQFSEPVLDLSLIRRYRSLKTSADASQFDADAARNKVIAMVSNLYFAVQRAKGIVEADGLQIELDEALLRLARDRREAGVGTGLDVTRSESRLASDRHTLLQAHCELQSSDYST
jgi:outer membrane protein